MMKFKKKCRDRNFFFNDLGLNRQVSHRDERSTKQHTRTVDKTILKYKNKERKESDRTKIFLYFVFF